jgi:adenylate cyclase
MPRRPVRGSQTFGAVLLQETVGTVGIFDLKGFTALASSLPPLDLGVTLGHYYGFAETCIQENDGRLVKFMGDAVLAVWLQSDVRDHQKQALAAVTQAMRQKPKWMEENQGRGFPSLDFTVGVATGPLLAGQIGTARNRNFDVLGAPVVAAMKLAGVATARGIDHLLALAEPQPECVEVEGVEMVGKLWRLFRLSELG